MQRDRIPFSERRFLDWLHVLGNVMGVTYHTDILTTLMDVLKRQPVMRSALAARSRPSSLLPKKKGPADHLGESPFWVMRTADYSLPVQQYVQILSLSRPMASRRPSMVWNPRESKPICSQMRRSMH